MSWQPRVLLVAPTLALAKDLFAWLTDAAYDVALVTSFAAAKEQLRANPALLISEIRLGEYNGLHLASRARSHEIPAIVVGDPDLVLERDARQMGVTYMRADIDRDYLLVLADHLTAGSKHRRRESGVDLSRQLRPETTHLSFVSSAERATVKMPQRRFD